MPKPRLVDSQSQKIVGKMESLYWQWQEENQKIAWTRDNTDVIQQIGLHPKLQILPSSEFHSEQAFYICLVMINIIPGFRAKKIVFYANLFAFGEKTIPGSYIQIID
jgi:hypothetical protein